MWGRTAALGVRKTPQRYGDNGGPRSASAAGRLSCEATRPGFLVLCLFLAMAKSLSAEDLQSWSEARIKVLDTHQVEVVVGGVARVRDSPGSLYDRRATAEAETALTDRFGVKLGYVLRNHTLPGFGVGSDHRLVAGLTYPILQQTVSVSGTTLYERHVGRPDVPDFSRYRQQFDVERLGVRVSPWLHQSMAFRREGFIRSRSRLGLRWRFASGHSLKSAYQFESIERGPAWRPRHAIYTEWSYELVPSEKASQ